VEALFDGTLSGGMTALLLGALLVALGFEFVNGFHDTANAVATVIYTKTLKATPAVMISGFCNFLGVFVGGIGVAMAIIRLLPVELLVASGASQGMAMVLALLLAAILWNLGTWYFGLPASSSHTLIGAILGVGLANSAMQGAFGSGVNWDKAEHVGLSLLASPIFGFALAAGLVWLLKKTVKDDAIFRPPDGDKPPPTWIRGLLITTCAGVSFAHGSNDGQKGVGLIMLILVGLLPASFALDPDATPLQIAEAQGAAEAFLEHLPACEGDEGVVCEMHTHAATIVDTLEGHASPPGEPATDDAAVTPIPREDRWQVREAVLRLDKGFEVWSAEQAETAELTAMRDELKKMDGLTDYAPLWVIIAVALALGIGTTVGYKRIVVTVGEKIGKSHLTYAQGASAELVAMSTIGASSFLGLPVSTTHVLSSGIAGTMVAQKSGLQKSTVRNIALAWVLTLPVAMLLSAGLFYVFSLIFA